MDLFSRKSLTINELSGDIKLLLCFLAVYVICKLGNDSQKAVQLLEKMSGEEVGGVTVKDISGGLMAWAKTIDPTFPQY